MGDISIKILMSELVREHNKERSSTKTIRVSEDNHTRLKKFAAEKGVSIQALINCFAETLPD